MNRGPVGEDLDSLHPSKAPCPLGLAKTFTMFPASSNGSTACALPFARYGPYRDNPHITYSGEAQASQKYIS